ncbi:uncharacterized protein LOC113579652 [Electrophorus electricus]|uniref:uncharacterized protein LOC113579652 n=1 Tax=Electrophorus electricus TaxID=8005 RepID=UPI0015D075C3|nr:uncharacterized protein LOC113579652 [Electrophorus electricus]
MQIHLALKMLVVLAVVLLARGVSEARTLSKCELRDRLNTTLPADVLDYIGELAKLVCFVEMSSGFDTAKSHNISVPELYGTSDERCDGEYQSNTTHGSSSEESDEDEDETTEPTLTTSAVNTAISPGGRASHHNRRARSVQRTSSSEEDDEAEEDDEDDERDTSVSISPAVNVSATLPPRTTGTPFNISTSAAVHRRRRSAHHEKPKNTEEWKLYGLFQLPDHIACSSGSQQSLNLCNMTCNRLLDDDISDDITCVGIVIRKMFSLSNEQSEEYVQEQYPAIPPECWGVKDSQYFSIC